MTSETYAKEFDNIDPLQPYKPWVEPHTSSSNKLMPAHERQIAAVFVVSDPVDWGRELQVMRNVTLCHRRKHMQKYKCCGAKMSFSIFMLPSYIYWGYSPQCVLQRLQVESQFCVPVA